MIYSWVNFTVAPKKILDEGARHRKAKTTSQSMGIVTNDFKILKAIQYQKWGLKFHTKVSF